jgi:putative glutamine amidotransferase
MRLVSALYQDFGPFGAINKVTAFDVVAEPSELREGDILIVHGGADISPTLYNKGRSSRSGAGPTPSRRDNMEWNLMNRAVELGIPIIGICRGAQMLCALGGGYLIQDVQGHGGTHVVENTLGDPVVTNSIHHQMMVPQGNFQLLGWTSARSGRYMDVDADGNDVILEKHPLGIDPEFVYHPDIKGYAIQWHPEMMRHNAPASEMIINLINSHD